ncbi:MAG: 16S rRNA (uracil(1498)-N(3))-methyltransferase [Bacteroides sp.]|nr:16S rRNA (uracil(1498)-N(3))-methyltransferase [Bacteroides sp.]
MGSTELHNGAADEKSERWRYPRFFGKIGGEKAYIVGDDARHIGAVLRMSRGDKAVICDNEYNDYLCSIASVQRDAVELDVLEHRKNETAPNTEITLFQCLPKGDKMDLIVQKATELGAVGIVPVLSKRCVSRPDGKSMSKKLLRWEKIAEEASKQCGGGKIPEIGGLSDYRAAISEYSKIGLGILFYECGGRSLSELPIRESSKIGIFVGSEGGFEPEEARFAEEKGVVLTSLGKRILRCETAPIAALSVLMNLTGNM